MKKLIKVQDERIIDIRPLDELNLYKDEELLKKFKNEFMEVELPKDYTDIEILSKFIYKDGNFIETDLFLKLKQLKVELDEIQLWFSKNDWIPNKILVGEWTTDDARWKDYLKERKSKRARRDEILALIGE